MYFLSSYLALFPIKNTFWGNSLAVQWLGLHASTAGGTGSIPGQGTKIPHATWGMAKKEKKKYYWLFTENLLCANHNLIISFHTWSTSPHSILITVLWERQFLLMIRGRGSGRSVIGRSHIIRGWEEWEPRSEWLCILHLFPLQPYSLPVTTRKSTSDSHQYKWESATPMLFPCIFSAHQERTTRLLHRWH